VPPLAYAKCRKEPKRAGLIAEAISNHYLCFPRSDGRHQRLIKTLGYADLLILDTSASNRSAQTRAMIFLNSSKSAMGPVDNPPPPPKLLVTARHDIIGDASRNSCTPPNIEGCGRTTSDPERQNRLGITLLGRLIDSLTSFWLRLHGDRSASPAMSRLIYSPGLSQRRR
jgi:hypothetical protein